VETPEKNGSILLYFRPTADRKEDTVGKKQQSQNGKNSGKFADYPYFFIGKPQNSQSSPNT
jgi:hypothetical protein